MSGESFPAGAASVLIVDDDLATRVLLREVLTRLGRQADVAPDGAEAIAWASRRRYDLVVVDLQMPHVTGEELLRVLPSTHSRDAHRIVFSGRTAPSQSTAPCCARILKPFDLPRFVAALESCLAGGHQPGAPERITPEGHAARP